MYQALAHIGVALRSFTYSDCAKAGACLAAEFDQTALELVQRWLPHWEAAAMWALQPLLQQQPSPSQDLAGLPRKALPIFEASSACPAPWLLPIDA